MSQIEQFRPISPDWSAKVVSRTSLSTMFCRMVVFLISLASTFLVSCSSDGEYTFRSPDDALRKYQNYASFLHGETALDTDGLIDALCHWQELSDTVYSYLCRDSLFDVNVHLSSSFSVTGDSIRTCLLMLSDSSDRSYADILRIKERTCAFRNDSSLVKAGAEAVSFYDSFGELKVSPRSGEEALSSYRGYLSSVISDGIHSDADLGRFLKFEDVLFRSFLDHLPEYSDLPLSDVTLSTETICRQVFAACNDGELDSRKVMIAMAVRTNRRLIQNAQVCIEEIRKGKVKDDEQMAAYQWMTIQPLLSMDALCVALLTDAQKELLLRIAEDFQKSLQSSKQDDATLRLMTEEIPKQILKLYISSL